MTSTDFFVAVSGEPERATPFGTDCRFHCSNEQDLIKEVISQSAESILLLAFVENKSVGKALCKAMFSFFAESINPNKDVYTQFRVSFVEKQRNDLIQYRCERLGDIDAVVEVEDGAHNCSSICATNVVPKETSFLFVEQRLTVMLCTEPEYTAENLQRIAENSAVMVGCRVASIGLYIPKEAMCNPLNLSTLATEGLKLKEALAHKTVGREERVSSRIRLQDIRAWSLMINETNHFSPVLPGPYFVSLNPQLVVGEKLAHYISEERSYIVGDSTNASPVDFCVMPPVADGDALHRSVYSPHCRIRREGYAVYLKAESGMTYLNGKLLSEEQQLQHNDRIILGKQLAFRFVMVGTELPKNPESRILDWELCSKEFRRENERVVQDGTQAALEQTNRELHARYDELETLVENARGDSWLMLTNPPSAYKGQLLWPFDLSKRHSTLTVGPQGDVALAFLTTSGTIKHAMDGLVYKSGTTTTPIANGSRFNIGAFTFAISTDESVAPGRTRRDTVFENGATPHALREMQSTFFSLQWSIGALFDFVFPVKGRKVKKEDDNYFAYRTPLYDTHLYEASKVHTTDIATLNTQLTAAVRLIGAGLAKEMREPVAVGAAAAAVAGSTSPPTASPRSRSVSAAQPPRSDINDPSKAEELLQALQSSAALSAAVLRQVHADIGAALLERCNGRVAPSSTSSPSKAGRGTSKDRPREASVASSSALPVSSTTAAKLLQLKGTCFVAAAPVVQRASSTVDMLNVSTNAKAVWERHVQHVNTMGRLFLEKKGEDANVLGELLLLIVDAVLSTDYCLRRRLLSANEVDGLDSQMAVWQKWAERSIAAIADRAHTSRTPWKHEAAVQRKPTPHVVRSSLTKNGEGSGSLSRTSAGNGGSVRTATTLSKLGSARYANGAAYTSAPPRINDTLDGGAGNNGRSSLSATYTGKTPHSLSSFGTLRKASISSATGTASGRGTRSSIRRSSSTAAPEKSGAAAAAARATTTIVRKRTPSTGGPRAVINTTSSGSGRKKMESNTVVKKS